MSWPCDILFERERTYRLPAGNVSADSVNQKWAFTILGGTSLPWLFIRPSMNWALLLPCSAAPLQTVETSDSLLETGVKRGNKEWFPIA